MILVYVETNFLIDLLRPIPTREAQRLHRRNGVDVRVMIPWCSLKEAERTLNDTIIKDDAGFADKAEALWGRLAQSDLAKWTPHGRSVQLFLKEVEEIHAASLAQNVQALEQFRQDVNVIGPSPRAMELALDFTRGKRMKPFDEAILGCVLADAELHASTVPKYFCNLNRRDFAPTIGNNLQRAYDDAGLIYLDHFGIP